MMRSGLSTILVLGMIGLLTRPALAIDLLSSANEYDYVVIAHDSFTSSLGSLLVLRESAGLRSCLVRTSEIATQFGGGVNSATGIREFIRYSAEHWSITPAYYVLVGDANWGGNPDSNLVPTFYPNPSESKPLESEFVRGSDGEVLARLGRIPCLTVTQLNNYLSKVIHHESSSTRGDWERNSLLLIGNRSGTVPLSIRSQVADIIESDLPWLTSTTLLGNDYLTQEAAEDVTLAAWISGAGLVVGYGWPWDEINSFLGMADFSRSAPPTFTERLPGNYHCPVVLGATCLMNRWFSSRAWAWSVPEDLLLARSDAGSIGVIGAGSASYMQDAINVIDTILGTIGNRDGGMDAGRLVASVWVDFVDRDWVPEDLSRSYNLLGDPAVRLYLPRHTPTSWSTGFEVTDDVPLQNRVMAQGLGASGVNSRVVAGSAITAPEGRRCMRFTLTPNADPQNADWADWEVARPELTIEKNTYLVYDELVASSPAGRGSVSVDGVTADGDRLAGTSAVKDQWGVTLNAQSRGTISGAWRSTYVDLSPLEGEELSIVSVCYADNGLGDQGQLEYYLDDVRLVRGDSENQVLNGGFEAVRTDGVPLGWEAIPGVMGSIGGSISDNYPAAGRHCALLFDSDCNGQGISQVVMLSPEDSPSQDVRFQAWGGGAIRVKILRGNAAWAVVRDVTIPVSDSWGWHYTSFSNSDAGLAWGQYRVELSAVSCGGVVHLDNVSVVESGVTGRGDDSPGGEKRPFVRISCPPIVSSARELRVSLCPAVGGRLVVSVMNVSGQRIGSWSGEGTAGVWTVLESSDLGLPNSSPSGVYYLVSTLDRKRGDVARVTIVH